ncbi:hypothetical protein VKT23_001302 [Stygiomarasmius scandens]|uniref:Uncharacterized protein n=1 Tax=Marasmiellus scandens TaxID=2682957 RepID=A0ABR1K708_9AGAR
MGPLEDIEDTETRQICLPKLRFLRCSFEYCEDVGSVFPALILPALTHFELVHLGRDLAIVTSVSLRGLLIRSSCRLEGLVLDSRFCAYSEQDLVSILSLTPTLTHLELKFWDCRMLTADFFQTLNLSRDGLTVLPNLLSLHIDLHAKLYLPAEDDDTLLSQPEAILSMIRSRRFLTDSPGRAELKSFVLAAHIDPKLSTARQWAQLFNSKVEPSLRILEEDGMEIKLQIQVCS